MEPMSVSPGKSPVNSGLYLPPFLMGHPTSPQSTGTPTSASPVVQVTPYSSRARNKVESDGGPPIVGLFDEITTPSAAGSPMGQSPNLYQTMNNTTLNCTMNNTSVCNDDGVNNYWIVVHGFPPNLVNQIIAMFSQLGRVIEHNYPVNSNWVCLCYTNQADMRKALSMDGKILSGNLMIGVKERKQQYRRDKNGKRCYHTMCLVHDLPKKPSSPESLGSSPISPIYPDRPEPKIGVDTSMMLNNTLDSSKLNNSVMSPTSPKIRPLAISKRISPQSPNSSLPVPTEDTSLVGKFMDFFFSW